MNKEVGRNDPCPCGSGKKYKKCCELRIGRRKFSASIIKSGVEQPGKASQISTNFFSRIAPKAPAAEAPPEPPHHPPEADKPM